MEEQIFMFPLETNPEKKLENTGTPFPAQSWAGFLMLSILPMLGFSDTLKSFDYAKAVRIMLEDDKKSRTEMAKTFIKESREKIQGYVEKSAEDLLKFFIENTSFVEGISKSTKEHLREAIDNNNQESITEYLEKMTKEKSEYYNGKGK